MQAHVSSWQISCNLTGTCKASRKNKVVSIALRPAQGRITRPHDAIRSLAQNPAAKCTADILCFRGVLPVGAASGRDPDQLQLALNAFVVIYCRQISEYVAPLSLKDDASTSEFPVCAKACTSWQVVLPNS